LSVGIGPYRRLLRLKVERAGLQRHLWHAIGWKPRASYDCSCLQGWRVVFDWLWTGGPRQT